MAYNKFVIRDKATGKYVEVLDLTISDVSPQDVRLGKTFHGPDGETYTGEYEPKLQHASFSTSGTFTPDEDYEGFSSVTIDIQGDSVAEWDGQLTIISSGNNVPEDPDWDSDIGEWDPEM